MNKKEYRNLLLLVNDIDKFSILQEYANQRIDILLSFLEKEKDLNKLVALQGAIAELRRFRTLRDEVIEGAKQWRLKNQMPEKV